MAFQSQPLNHISDGDHLERRIRQLLPPWLMTCTTWVARASLEVQKYELQSSTGHEEAEALERGFDECGKPLPLWAIVWELLRSCPSLW